MIPVHKHMRAQAGFTLVELAIVMIIIGLLIAGVLKGQALIQNAQVTATVAQTKAIEAATTTFRDTYNMLPGDMTSPTTKLPNCGAAPCATAGNGNATLDNFPSTAPNIAANEGHQFFVHLNAASLLTGIVPGVGAASDVWGGNFPAGKITGNGFFFCRCHDRGCRSCYANWRCSSLRRLVSGHHSRRHGCCGRRYHVGFEA
jgi:prepilin-type N-terminal cleavage/methylation domain-containing protein